MKNLYNRFGLIFLILLPCLAMGCQKKEDASGPKRKDTLLTFNVDGTLLALPYINEDLGIQLRPPKNWLAKDDTTFSKLIRIDTKSPYQISPRQIFINDSLKCCCIISEVDSVNIKEGDLVLKAIEAQFRSFDPNGQIFPTEFYTEHFRVRQVLAIAKNFVFFRLLCDHPKTKIFQVDYILPQATYQQYVRTIESSIGTFQPLKM